MSVFACFECFCRFRIYKFKHMWLEDVLRPCGSKKIAKRGPKWPNISKVHGLERAQNAAFEKRQRPNLPEATTSWPWGPPRPVVVDARPCILGGMAVLHHSPQFAVFLRVFSSSYVFCFRFLLFCLYKRMYLNTLEVNFQPHSIPHSPFSLV